MNYYQQNALIPVRSEAEARNFPVALGNSITFKNESAPYVYTKTMGTSPFEQPVFVKYRLEREEEAHMDDLRPQTENVSLEQFNALTEAVNGLRMDVDALKAKRPSKKKEVSEDDSE